MLRHGACSAGRTFLKGCLGLLISLCVWGLALRGEVRGEEEPGQVLPPQPLTIDAAVVFGLANNPVLKSAEEEVKAAEAGVEGAFSKFLPRLDTSYKFTQWATDPAIKVHGFPGVPDVELPMSSTTVNHWEASVTQSLFRGYGVQAGYEVSREEKKAAEHKRSELRLDLVRDIQATFFEILLTEKILQTAREHIHRLEAHHRDAQSFFRQGIAPENDVLKADVALASATQRERVAGKNLTILHIRLRRLLGLEGRAPLLLSAPYEDLSCERREVPLPDLSALLVRAQERRPELASLDAGIRGAEQMVRVARSSAYPHVSLFATTYREGQDFLATVNEYANEYNAAVGIRVDWNWYEGGRMEADVSRWRHKAEALKRRREDILKQVQVEVTDALEGLRVAQTNLHTACVAIGQARENLRMTTLQYREQVVRSSEILDAQVYLSQSQTDFYLALYGYRLAGVQLDRAVGGTPGEAVATGQADGRDQERSPRDRGQGEGRDTDG